MTTRDLRDAMPERSAGSSISRGEALAVGAVLLFAAAVRFVDLPTRGTFDADQGHEMLALLGLVREGTWPLVGDVTSVGGIHQGALYLYLLAPVAWLSGADPIVVVAEIALLATVAVGLVWWIARSLGGTAAGLAAAILAAASATAIERSTYLWNPNVLAFSTGLMVAGAFQAWRSQRARWWLVSAVGLAITLQGHVLGLVMVPPIVVLLIADVRRRQPGARPSVIAAAFGGLLLVALSYVPLAIYELTHDFADTRAAIHLLTTPGQAVALDPVSRLVFIGLRILSWPLAGQIVDAPIAGALAATGALVALVAMAWRPKREVHLARWLALTIAWGWIVLSITVPALAVVTPLPVDHYHAFLDPLVIVGTGVGIGFVWDRARGAGVVEAVARTIQEGVGVVDGVAPAAQRAVPSNVWRALAAALVLALVAFNVSIWPPATSPDGGWPAAHAAALRIEGSMPGGSASGGAAGSGTRESGAAASNGAAGTSSAGSGVAGGPSIELVSLPAFKSPDAYGFPLVRDGYVLSAGPAVDRLVVVCDALFVQECNGPAEAVVSSWPVVDRFAAAPGRTITVFARP